MGNVMAFLNSDAANGISGVTLLVDGGYVMASTAGSFEPGTRWCSSCRRSADPGRTLKRGGQVQVGQLEGKVAAVTGASSGSGVGISKRLLEEGASVVMLARGKDRLEEVATGLGPERGADGHRRR